MITNFGHICFVVKDLEANVAFYTDKLGFKHVFDFLDDQGKPRGCFLLIGQRNFIELFRGDHDAPTAKPGFTHFCLEVDDIERTVADLRAKGVEVTDINLGKDKGLHAWLNDPDGNRIELQFYTPDCKQQSAFQP